MGVGVRHLPAGAKEVPARLLLVFRHAWQASMVLGMDRCATFLSAMPRASSPQLACLVPGQLCRWTVTIQRGDTFDQSGYGRPSWGVAKLEAGSAGSGYDTSLDARKYCAQSIDTKAPTERQLPASDAQVEAPHGVVTGWQRRVLRGRRGFPRCQGRQGASRAHGLPSFRSSPVGQAMTACLVQVMSSC